MSLNIINNNNNNKKTNNSKNKKTQHLMTYMEVKTTVIGGMSKNICGNTDVYVASGLSC